METRIGVVLDASGSMEPLVEKTLSGLNEYFADRKSDQFKTGEPISISAVQFRSTGNWTHNITEVDWIYKNRPVQEINRITADMYRPGGGTPLYDAIGIVIQELDLTACEHNRTLLVILTDGEENTSTKFTRSDIFELISRKQNENWTIIYLGANQDAFKGAGAIGIHCKNTANYKTVKMGSAFAGVSRASTMYLSSKVRSMNNAMEAQVDTSGEVLDTVPSTTIPSHSTAGS